MYQREQVCQGLENWSPEEQRWEEWVIRLCHPQTPIYSFSFVWQVEFLLPECGAGKWNSKLKGSLGLVVQLVAEGLSPTLLLVVKSSGKLQHDTPVLSLCRSGRLDLGGHIKNWWRTVDILCEVNGTASVNVSRQSHIQRLTWRQGCLCCAQKWWLPPQDHPPPQIWPASQPSAGFLRPLGGRL